MSGSASLAVQVRVLYCRALQDLLAQPGYLARVMAATLGFLLLNDGILAPSLGPAVGGNYLAFILPVGTLVAAASGSSVGALILQDKQDLYLRRLSSMPVSGVAIVLGPIGVGTTLSLVNGAAVLVLGAAIGAGPASGVAGAVAILGLAALWGAALTGFIAFVAVSASKPETLVAASQVIYPLIFLAPVFVGVRHLAPWIHAVASVNPSTITLRGMRDLMAGAWHVSSLTIPFLILAALAVFNVTLAALSARSSTAFR